MESARTTPLVVICGPTAVGKTEVAIALAERLPGEILNADSMQVYCGMDIGTAKPSFSERKGIPFHLLDLVDPDQPFTVADWKRLAEAAIHDVIARNRIPILCGGTGLYLRALLEDWSLAKTPRDPEIRRQLEREVSERGASTLHRRLEQVDPTTAARLHPNDTVRIVRALEVFLVSHVPLSEHLSRDQELRSQQLRSPRHSVQIGLTMAREILYKRIDHRVEKMMQQGLEQEVRSLLDRGFVDTLPPMKSLGYKELALYIGGELEFDSALDLIKQNTRRYAKRQQTWFRAEPALRWLDMSALSSAMAAEVIWEALQLAQQNTSET